MKDLSLKRLLKKLELEGKISPGWRIRDVLGNYDALYNQHLVGENEPSETLCEEILKKAIVHLDGRSINESIREQLIQRKNEY